MDPSQRQQTTIANPVSVSGFGFWSGLDVTIEFRPAAADTGRVFVRRDLPGRPRIDAAIQNRIPGPRRTTLVHQGHEVEMVEHVLAALAGQQIDNCEMVVDRAEMPGLDGSSEPFVTALQSAGRIMLGAKQPVLKVLQPIRVSAGDAWIQAIPETDSVLQLTYELDYSHAPAIGTQSCSFELDSTSFVEQIAAARTFLLDCEAAQLQKQGLGDRVSFRDVLIFDDHGPIQNSLRFSNECARHKTLDMIGDFALAGQDIVGKFIAFKSGHLLNSQMVFALLQQNVSSLFNRQSA